MVLNATELALLRSDAQAAICNQTATISRRTRVQDAQGGGTDTWTTIASNVPCALTANKARNNVWMAQQLMSLADQTVLVPVGTAVSKDDRMQIAGQTFRVLGPPYGRTINVLTHVDLVYDVSLP